MAYPSSLHSLAPGYSPWDDTSMLINSPSSGIMPTQDEYNLHVVEGTHKFLCVILAFRVVYKVPYGMNFPALTMA